MPTEKCFDQAPPFPEDVPKLSIPSISLLNLQNGDSETTKEMYEACQVDGFFILDLSESHEGEILLQNAEQMFELAGEVFALGSEILETFAYQPPHDLTGYKSTGKLKTDDGKLDLIEMYNINQDDMVGNSPPRRNPDPIQRHRENIKEFIHLCHSVVTIIQHRLEEQLGLEPDQLSSLNSLHDQSDTSVRLLRTQTQTVTKENLIALGGHTDIGTITLLFNVVGGLQVLPANKENLPANWRYIRPQPNCAIVNIGDTTVEWTGGVLRSSLHRVIKPPGEQAHAVRQSVAYLVRPCQSASMSRLVGGIVPSLQYGERDETRSVKEWAAWRSRQVISGELKPQSRGGILRRPV
ncbi:oxidoreductase2OG-Fe(II) oxygenase family [Penicillium diatomitis]|uniref:Oxidoreductase2OG-Fe(II) oxygenase family n=1 Tax=Penicillium diatomitis TaxID=2819901 RepID=A0A9W9XMC3_9EURO|nr:oxidoreductase2OG-Fe(II) oxygenase family [Penicillium diatomitis]KAJ5495612.1 oxidoreductase2OG-Fe(II) oxygenase family [Penicillium diatomitis]